MPPNKRLHLKRAPSGDVVLDCLGSYAVVGQLPQLGAVVAAQVKRSSVRRLEEEFR